MHLSAPTSQEIPALDHEPTLDTRHVQAERRYEFLDVLRGFGACAVFLQHVGERLSPEFSWFTTYYFQLGQCGVMLFFLCSGFIIPASLERHNSLTKFWIGRVFRLYPLYWLSLAMAIGLDLIKIYRLPQIFSEAPVLAILANMSMIQTFVGISDALPPYWSLTFEMLFYFIISGLFFLQWHKNTGLLTMIFLILALLISLACSLLGIATAIHLGYYIASMFVGTLLYRVLRHEMAPSLARVIIVCAVVVGIMTLALGFWGRDDPSTGGTKGFLPMLSAWIGAYLVFGVVFLQRKRQYPRLFLHCGVISYSIYLLHPFVMTMLPIYSFPLLAFALWVSIVIGVATLTYNYVEVPCITLGRRIIARWSTQP